MASQRASITKELLHESLQSVLRPSKIHSLDDGKFSCVLEFLMGREVFVNRPTGSGTQLVVSNIRPFSRVHSPRARCEESVLLGYPLPCFEGGIFSGFSCFSLFVKSTPRSISCDPWVAVVWRLAVAFDATTLVKFKGELSLTL